MRARVREPAGALPQAHLPGQTPDEHGHRRARLGPFLCWAVVFADIGTSIYYVPGILYGRVAQEVFSRAESVGRRLGLRRRRYVYVPAQEQPGGVRQVWKTIRPRDTLAVAGDEAALGGIAPDRVRRPAGGALPIVHYLKHWDTPP